MMPRIFLFDWTCARCGAEHEVTSPWYWPGAQEARWPERVKCPECGMEHRVDYDYDPSEGPNIQVFMIEVA